MNKFVLFGTLVASIMVIGPIVPVFAQYLGNVGQAGETGAQTLEETLELAQRRVQYVEENPASGSGTPYFAADGVLGASAIAGAVFGGVALAFFIRGRSGKYVAQGRG